MSSGSAGIRHDLGEARDIEHGIGSKITSVCLWAPDDRRSGHIQGLPVRGSALDDRDCRAWDCVQS